MHGLKWPIISARIVQSGCWRRTARGRRADEAGGDGGELADAKSTAREGLSDTDRGRRYCVLPVNSA